MNDIFSQTFSSRFVEAGAYAAITKAFSNEVKNQNELSVSELSNAKIDAFVNSGIRGEEKNGEIKLWKEELSNDEKTDPKSTEIYKLLNSPKPNGNIVEALQYSLTQAIFGGEKKGTFMEQFIAMSNEKQLEIVKFYDENAINFSAPNMEEKASALFLEPISIDEWKNRVKELSEQSGGKNIKADFGNLRENLSKVASDMTSADDQIARKNRMLLRQYNGAKSKNINAESKNELLKTFFEEFLKNQNPLALLEIMKKTDIRAWNLGNSKIKHRELLRIFN